MKGRLIQMMSERRHRNVSKFLSYILRHHPEEIGLELHDGGWANVADLLSSCGKKGWSISVQELETMVAENDKQRFAFSVDRLRIRAVQGHSFPVNLGYVPTEPPEILYHGTARQNLTRIRSHGLVRGTRQHVHLSPNALIAKKVGQRHGKPLVLEIPARRMHEDGHVFYLSSNGVWLTEHVPPNYVVCAEQEER